MPASQRGEGLIAVQRTIGNFAASRLVAGERTTPFTFPIRRKCSCGGTTGPDGECDACRAKRVAAQRSIGVDASAKRAPTPFMSTAAKQASPLPKSVAVAHAASIEKDDLDAALQLVAKAMEQRGDIDTKLMAAPAAATGAAVCSTTARYALSTSMEGALTTACGCEGASGSKVPNARIEVGSVMIKDLAVLHSTLLHEFRHVKQERERCNIPGITPGRGGACTDCNSPDEMDSYLSEVESGYDKSALLNPWVRVYVNWTYLAPEQQQVFQARKDAAQKKIERFYGKMPWERYGMVSTYQRHCEKLTEDVRKQSRNSTEETKGTCDDALAPLSRT
jgi:hypothetical protein